MWQMKVTDHRCIQKMFEYTSVRLVLSSTQRASIFSARNSKNGLKITSRANLCVDDLADLIFKW